MTNPQWLFVLGGGVIAAVLTLWKTIGLSATPVGTRRRSTGYVNGSAIDLELESIDGKGNYLTPNAASKWYAMYRDARASGIELKINSSFRTYAQQSVQLKERGPDIAMKPGFSPHQRGIALDIQSDGGRGPSYLWLANNAHRFGFKQTALKEPWHWQTVS